MHDVFYAHFYIYHYSIFSFLLQKTQKRNLWKFTFTNRIFQWMTKLCNVFILILCCSLTGQQAWSCTKKVLSELTDTKIYTVPLILNNTPMLTLCLASPHDQYDVTDVGSAYGLTLKGYREEGVWENNLTRLDGLTKEDVLDKLTDHNFGYICSPYSK